MSTVYWHLAFIRKKFGVHSNLELIHELLANLQVDISLIKLTPRGKEVFELAMLGLSINEISHRLGISYSAVLRHREKMLLENKCNSMFELIMKCYKRHK